MEGKRYFGMDIHRDYAVLAAVSRPKEMVMSPRRVDFVKLEAWLRANLRPEDEVALEATVNAWTVHDLVSPLVARCVVADARQIRLIANASVKTDAQDALRLASLLSVDMLPEVWVPPQHVRDVRTLIAHRMTLCKRRVIALNRIRSVLNRHNLEQPDDLEAGNDWLLRIEGDLSTVERLLVADDLASLLPLNAGLAIAEGELARMSQDANWRDMAPRVMQLTGFGIVHTMTVLGAIGDIQRFESAQQLAGYTGLYPSKDQSGQKDRSGRITKHGRRDLRHVLVEAARTAVRMDARWKKEHETLCARMHEFCALTAIARKLAELIWHVLHEVEPARHATDEQLAKKFLSIRDQLRAQKIEVIESRMFIRQQMRKIGHRSQATEYMHGKRRRLIASEAELAAFEAENSKD